MDSGRSGGGTWVEAASWAPPQDGGGAPGVQTGDPWQEQHPGGPGGGSRPLSPPEPPRRRLPAWVLRVGVALVVFAGATAFAALRSADRDQSGAVVDGGEVGVFDVRVGDCLGSVGEPSDEGVSSLSAVPCDEPHDSEVFALVDHPGEPDAEFPGDEALADFAQERCAEEFATYVGLAYVDSRYGIATLMPSADTWADGDRELVCRATDFGGGQLTGSVRGTAE